VKLDKDLRELLALFDSHRVEYLVVGGHAVAFHGHPRYTEELVLFVRPTLENGARVVDALHTFGFGSLDIAATDIVADDRVIQLGRAPNRVDLLTQLCGVNFADAWATRVRGSLDAIPVNLIGVDELIGNKRATARPQDVADAANLEAFRDS
jgi:hypothetical protein